jgi:hypothetical protein
LDWGSKNNKNYDKVKHLVEVDDDILAFFIIISNRIEELYIAKNSKLDKDAIYLLVSDLRLDKDLSSNYIELPNSTKSIGNNGVGKIKWDSNLVGAYTYKDLILFDSLILIHIEMILFPKSNAL